MIFDLFGVLTSLLSTYFFIRRDIRAWYAGMLSTLVNGGLYWHQGIYADMALEVFYFCFMWYGLVTWSRTKKNSKERQVTHLKLTKWPLVIGAVVGLYGLFYLVLIVFTQSSVAKLDALTTSLSVVAQWLICYKISATWILWFLADCVYAVLYYEKQLPYHTVMATIYTGLAALGYYTWVKSAHHPKLSQNLAT